MIELAPIIARIAAQTGYTVDVAKESQINLPSMTDLPLVFVGHMEINPFGEVGTDWSGDMYENNAIDLQQKLSVQIVCEAGTLPVHWEAVKDSLVGWNPDATQEKYSTMRYGGGGVLGLTNGRIWWVDNWLLNFPKIT